MTFLLWITLFFCLLTPGLCDNHEDTSEEGKLSCDSDSSINQEIQLLKNQITEQKIDYDLQFQKQKENFEVKITEQKIDYDLKFQRQKENFEEKITKLKNIISIIVPDDKRADIEDLFKSGDIEEDVKENTMDIQELRLDVYHQEYVHQTDTNVLNTTIQQNAKALDQFQSYIDATLAPVGTITAWLPTFSVTKSIPEGWMRCDGSLIEVGPFSGQATPDLNLPGLFLRGGADNMAGQTQEDTLQQHIHVDEGHSHVDAGHSHQDTGHVHNSNDYYFWRRRDGGAYNLCDEGCSSYS
jgi:hypothetical protein